MIERDKQKVRSAVKRRLIKSTDLSAHDIDKVASFIMANFYPNKMFRKEADV